MCRSICFERASGFLQNAEFDFSDHYALNGFLDVHPCYGLGWRQGQAAARAGRGQLTELRNRAIVVESKQAKEMLRLGQEELTLYRQRTQVGDVSAFQREQVRAARRRRDARASAYSKSFGRESLFAPGLLPEYAAATGCPVPPSSIGIRGFDSLRQNIWADLDLFEPVGFWPPGQHMLR